MPSNRVVFFWDLRIFDRKGFFCYNGVIVIIFMGFENFETRKRQELESEGQEKFNVAKKVKEGAVNPEFADADKETSEKQKSEEAEQAKKQQEKIAERQKTIQTMEASQVAPEKLSASRLVESSHDLWPPVIFDDTDAALRAKVGGTE